MALSTLAQYFPCCPIGNGPPRKVKTKAEKYRAPSPDAISLEGSIESEDNNTYQVHSEQEAHQMTSLLNETQTAGKWYKRGWKPSFDDFDDFFGHRSTIHDTGYGSSQRITMRKHHPPGYEEPKTYQEVKKMCVDEGILWEDPDFPAVDSSMFFSKPPSPYPNIEWLRPHEICDDPHMFTGGASRMDIVQGVLGDCWLLAAVSCLATNDKLLHHVVPHDSSLKENYAGLFHFNFWQYGRWVEVMVDDRLPTSNGKLIYMHSESNNEFWTALLEKAYAKLNGSYEALSGGLTSEALTDFTGGIVERFSLEDPPEDMLNMMLKAQKRALMGCSIDASPDQMEAALDNGLIIGHAYSITDVRMVDIVTPRVSGSIPMVRVRNPWGDGHEWTGPFSDSSEEWTYIPAEEREEMGLTFTDDGEFWMTFNDWKESFKRLEICYLSPDSLAAGPDAVDDETEAEIKKWEGTLLEGSWKSRINAGGCRNFSSFWTNPQYKIQIDEADDDDKDGNCSVIIGLMQKERRKLKKVGQDNHAIGYAVYALDDPDCGNLTPSFFNTHPQAAKSSYINLREVSNHHKLAPGHYVIVPTTFNPNEEAEFILRVLTEKADPVSELDDKTYIGPDGEDEIPDDEDETAREAFHKFVGDDGEVDAYELRNILNETFVGDFTFDGFSTDVCRGMVALKDVDMSGKLDFSDFLSLWKDLYLCKKVFKSKDADGNGYFDCYEFRQCLNTIGLHISNSTFNAIVLRYSNKEGHVTFDDFVACTVKLKGLFQVFKQKDKAGARSTKFKTDEHPFPTYAKDVPRKNVGIPE